MDEANGAAGAVADVGPAPSLGDLMGATVVPLQAVPDPAFGAAGAMVSSADVVHHHPAVLDTPHQHPVAVDPSHTHGWAVGGQPLPAPAVNDPIGWLTARVEALEARLGPISEHGQDRTDLALTGLLAQILKVEARLAHVERASGIAPVPAAEG